MEKFAKNHNEFWGKVKEYLDQAKKWFLQNKKFTFPATFVVLIAVIALGIFGATRPKEEKGAEVAQASMEVEESKDTDEIPVVPLEEGTHPEVEEFIKTYYAALAEGDMDTVLSLRSYTDDTERIKMLKKSNYVDKYENIITYTKEGPIDNSYIAYVYYEVKFNEIDTLAPALSSLYLVPDETKGFKIWAGDFDEYAAKYIVEVSAQEDADTLFSKVEVKYSEAIEADENLNKFLTELPTRLKTEVGEELAAVELANANVEVESEEDASDEVIEETPEVVTITEETVKATTTVNVRSSDSETADKLGKAEAGKTFKRVEALANGWSKIIFEGKEAFVKSEFLEVVESKTVEVSSTETETTVTAPEGKIVVKETVNVRKSASETAEKLGVAYKGDTYELIMKQADGWTKINYKGQTAYVKSDYVN